MTTILPLMRYFFPVCKYPETCGMYLHTDTGGNEEAWWGVSNGGHREVEREHSLGTYTSLMGRQTTQLQLRAISIRVLWCVAQFGSESRSRRQCHLPFFSFLFFSLKIIVLGQSKLVLHGAGCCIACRPFIFADYFYQFWVAVPLFIRVFSVFPWAPFSVTGFFLKNVFLFINLFFLSRKWLLAN